MYNEMSCRLGKIQKLDKSTGSEDPIALVLCRGAGLCDLDFSNTAVMKQWKDVEICSHHVDELYKLWGDAHGFRDKHIYRRRLPHGRSISCSMPTGIGEDHPDHRPADHLHPLTIKEANAILTESNILVHPGIPVCPDHKKYLSKLLSKSLSPLPKRSKTVTNPSVASDDSDDNEVAECSDSPYLPYDNRVGETKKSFLDFAHKVGISRVCTQADWKNLKETTKQRKASAARKLIDTILSIMVPDETMKFRQLVENKLVQLDSWTTGSSEDLNAIMNQIAEHYFASEDRNNRILILSLVANSVSYLKVEKYIPGLSSYMYEKAKRFARRKRETKNKHTPSEKYKREDVEKFIEFITSPTVMIGLPFGVRKVKLADGSKIEIPDSIRQQSHTEIIEMFKKVREENDQNDFKMSESTMYKILNACAATKRESTTCVDYFIAIGMESFDGLHKIVDTWKDYSLFEPEIIKAMKRELFEAAQYLRTDFRLHVKGFSRVADHCANFALSDPTDSRLAISCSSKPNSHVHDLKCDRCEKMNAILETMENHAKEFVSEKEADVANSISNDSEQQLLTKHKEELELIQKYKKGILEMKKHLLRAAVSNEERQEIVAGLNDNEALVTMDFAQKFLPKWHREKQCDYFGKKGISYHISHVTARIGNTYAQHSFVHIYEDSVAQDSQLVVLTMLHFLAELKKAGILKVFLRSDNAGAYHSASTIGSLPWLMTETKMQIGSYSFSEAQNGKSASDRDANRVKRRVQEYINKGNDVTNSLQFFKALEDQPLNGVSVYHGNVVKTQDPATDWKGISNLNYFSIENNGIRSWKYHKIGAGIFKDAPSLKPLKGTCNFAKSSGFTASKIDSDALRKAEREAVEQGKQTSFWYHPKCAKSSSCVEEVDDVSTSHEDFVPRNNEGDLYSCPEHGCSSTFLKFSNLEKHILKGKHRIAPERMTERDYALNFFARKLEEVNSANTCPIVATAVNKMKESSNKESLKMGWALPEKRTRRIFSNEMVSFLTECFNQGVKLKKPMNPVAAEELMRTAKNSDGSRKFNSADLLDSRQIAGFFSREADKRRHAQQKGTDRLCTEEEEDVLKEQYLNPLSAAILKMKKNTPMLAGSNF
ncbi:hypothetical protein CAEBREN_17783 [Caenorhabditis brenneri]|uniref:C2H2-type domain-containing protein n=1 Tax=Caenorhabditis brenneri TaxID=135651 RepID=G0NA08_CAEBE|nr:hypothetical protein CAEBREN_17783 [Caenorhabditis brenneri]